MTGKSQLANTNKLIKNYRGITGLKTGSTALALYNLSASATRDNLSLIAVIMKAPSTNLRFVEAAKLLDYGFSKFSFKNFGNKGDVVQKLPIDKATTSFIDIVLENNTGALIEKGKENQISQEINLEENISAPIKSGQKLGEIYITLDGNILNKVNLVAKNNIEKKNLFNMSKELLHNWITLLRT